MVHCPSAGPLHARTLQPSVPDDLLEAASQYETRTTTYPGAIALNHPDRPAVIEAESGRQLTYQDNSARLAKVFYDAGLRRGDVVMLLTDNTIEAFEVLWAALRSGLYITTVNRHLTAAEVSYMVTDSAARAIVVSAGLGQLAVDVGALVDAGLFRLAFGGTVAGFGSYTDALHGANDRLVEQPAGAIMLYSSGTTGFPKGVKSPLMNRTVDEPGDFMVPVARDVYGLSSADVYLSPAPIYHAAPLRWGGAIHALGGTIVMMAKFDAERTLEYIEKYRVTAAQMVPTMFVRMLKLPADVRVRHDLSTVRVLIHAAAPCPPEVKQAMIDWLGPVLYEYYSCTEANGMTFINTSEWLERPGSVGRSSVGVAHICAEDGTLLADGEVGEIYFERDALPFIYHNAPEKTVAAKHPDHPNWTTVGDLGYLDAEGYLFLTDRKSFMIISGGVNIYPQEVENVLTLHPAVRDVAVIGIPDSDMGEQVRAVIEPEPGVIVTPELERELIDYVRDRVAHFKAPRSVVFVSELPRTPTGKLVKGKLTGV
jgi:long-chain acyl-CoA synthetase